MHYPKDMTQEISFPLGGIGSGCIGLSGNGRLVDWEIFNRSNKNSLLGNTHFAIASNGKYRLLQGDCFEPYTGKYRKGDDNRHHGFGWGVEGEQLAGLPHFRNHCFNGTYPVAEVEFSGEDENFPIQAKLTAWSPFIPGMERESSLPCAVLEYTFTNHGTETAETTVVGVLQNPWNVPGHKNRIIAGKRLTVSNPAGDEISLTALECCENISGQEYLYRGGWQDSLEMYLNNLKAGGRFQPRTYSGPVAQQFGGYDHGLLAVHFTLAPGEEKTIRFAFTWHMETPRENDWNPYMNERAEKNNIPLTWKNYYSTQWKNSGASAEELTSRFDELRNGTFLFRDLLHRSDLDPAIIDGASACLSTLKSPTCLRWEDGTLWGWEGVGTSWGSCEGSCIHVWNYAMAACFLFPGLERSMQESHLKYSVDAFGAAHFRLQLPPGLKAEPSDFRPCADGQFGLIMKFYRDWKICGDQEWLKRWYPTLKSMMQYTWSKNNTDCWDPGKSGLITGRQHHTLDMELFGANGWIHGFYLGALAAMSEMAESVEDHDFAEECKTVLVKGKSLTKTLFNGKHFIQKIDLKDRSVLEKWDDTFEAYWNTEAGEIKYQIGDGLEIDSCLGEYFSVLFGIGSVFEPAMTKQTLQEIYRRNFISVRELENPWRSYAVNDEKGVCICTWNGDKPAIPLPYNSEMMNGFEWSFASHLILSGEMTKAVEVVRAIRDRYDGRKRNPWNEFECGNNYARSMAAFGLIPAALGFKFDVTRGMIGFDPKKEISSCFWSLGSVWGEYRKSADSVEIAIAFGKISLKELQLSGKMERLYINGKEIQFITKGDSIFLTAELSAGDVLQIIQH